MRTACGRLLVLTTIVLFVSCERKTVFMEEREIKNAVWYQDSALVFNVRVTDTLYPCKIDFTVDNNDDYSYSNLYLFANVKFPGGKTIRDTVELILADGRGKWTGKGLLGSHENLFSYRGNIRFPEEGIYTFSIVQAMRCPSQKLDGIKSFKLSVLKR